MRLGGVDGDGVVWDETCRWERGERKIVRQGACRSIMGIVML